MDCGTRELITTAHVGANGPERDSAALYPRLNSLAPPLKVKFSSGAKSEAKRPTGFRKSRGSSASLRGRSAFCSLSPSRLSSVQGGDQGSTGDLNPSLLNNLRPSPQSNRHIDAQHVVHPAISREHSNGGICASGFRRLDGHDVGCLSGDRRCRH